MMMNQKKRILQKLWGWTCLSINCLAVSFHLTGQYEELRKVAILLSLSPVCYGVFKTQMDKVKGDMSVVTVVIEYVCVYIITFVLGFKMASDLSSVSVLITLVIVSFLEILIFLIVNYWNYLRVFFSKKTMSPRKTKK